MSDYKTMDVIHQMADHAEGYTWETTTPAKVFRSPIPPGNMTWPALGIYSEGGAEGEAGGLGYTVVRGKFKWVLATFLDLGSLDDQYRQHMEWRDEARKVVRRANDYYWGLGGTVTRVNLDPVWESDFFEMGEENAPIGHLVATTLRTEVEYREIF